MRGYPKFNPADYPMYVTGGSGAATYLHGTALLVVDLADGETMRLDATRLGSVVEADDLTAAQLAILQEARQRP